MSVSEGLQPYGDIAEGSSGGVMWLLALSRF